MDKSVVADALRAALVTEEEYLAGPDVWNEEEDPFDFFPYEDELEDNNESGDEDEHHHHHHHHEHDEEGKECQHHM